ncbi:MAG: DNA gyrase subunit A [Clostridiales bacterium]|jgi:DNA gyrase subunit A|nr:DNA gyrase subunit A [Clostridiales bacterium]
MAKNNDKNPPKGNFPGDGEDNSKIVHIRAVDEMKKSFIAYAMAVNVSRAIPDVRDGLKPVQRRILFSMNELSVSHDKPHRKCARIVGDCMGKYHPHGDSSIYGALVHMAQPFAMRMPLVDGQGNFGSVDGDPPAAQRYTEARLSKLADVLLADIDKDTVDFYPNFDDTLQQPTVLPARYPNLLVNGSDGIAVGMATNIPPHNLGEVINGVVALIDNPDITAEGLMQYIPAPDYPTGGVLMGAMGLRQAYLTGKGSYVLRSKCEIEEHGDRSRIVVTELPYYVNKAELIETIANLVKDKRVEGISDIKEESDRKGLRVVIDLKRDAQAQVVLSHLYKHSKLQISGGITFLCLVGPRPKICNLKEMLEYYLIHQKEVVLRRTKYDLARAEERAHILEGLVIALANIDEVVQIIKKSRDKVEAAEELQKAFLLSDKQANAILEMRLHRLTSLEVETIKAELDELHAKIDDFRAIIASPDRIAAIVRAELLDVGAKFPDPRRTAQAYDDGDVILPDLIKREDVAITMTHFGYIKRLPVTEYRAQGRGGRGVSAIKTREEDFVEKLFVTNTHNDLLFLTNLGRVYCIKAYEVPEAQRAARGRAIVNLLQLAGGEQVSAVIPMAEGDYDKGHLVMATRMAVVKKTPLSEFARINKNGKIAIALDEGDELISVQRTSGEGLDELIIASTMGKCIRFSEAQIRSLSRGSRGVRSIKLTDDDFVVDMTVLKPGFDILTVTQWGIGKRTDQGEYRLQGRAGSGVKAGSFGEKTGRLVNLKLVGEQDDVMLISSDGTIIRMRAATIRKIGRAATGVRLMRMQEGDEVVSVAVIEHGDDEPQEVEDAENVELDEADNGGTDANE